MGQGAFPGGAIGDRRTKTFVQVRGHEPRSIAFRIPNRAGKGRLPMLSSPACFGGAKKGKYQKWGDDRHMEVGQDRELYPNLPLIGEALHCSTPPTPRNTQTEGKKKWFGEGLVREIEKRKAYPFFF